MEQAEVNSSLGRWSGTGSKLLPLHFQLATQCLLATPNVCLTIRLQSVHGSTHFLPLVPQPLTAAAWPMAQGMNLAHWWACCLAPLLPQVRSLWD